MSPTNPTWKFDTDTAVAQNDKGWEINISPDWNILAPNGGFVTAIAVEAMRQDSLFAGLIAVHAHFHKPTATELSHITVEILSTSKRLQTLEARLWQKGELASTFLATFADRSSISGREFVASEPPTTLVDGLVHTGGGLPFHNCVEIALPAAQHAWITGELVDDLQFWGTMKFTDDRPIDDKALAMLADASAPPALRMTGPLGWVPTIDYSVQIRRPPAPEQRQVKFRSVTRFITEGLVETDIELWSMDDQILALGRQLAMLRER